MIRIVEERCWGIRDAEDLTCCFVEVQLCMSFGFLERNLGSSKCPRLCELGETDWMAEVARAHPLAAKWPECSLFPYLGIMGRSALGEVSKYRDCDPNYQRANPLPPQHCLQNLLYIR